jgi:methionyl-tRNA synthetase
MVNGKYFYKCPCSRGETHCDDCGVCFAKNETGKPYTIYVKYHGLVAANGFKNLFKKDEIENVIEKLHQNGWITDEEYKSYLSPRNQKFLKDISKKIEQQRKGKKAKN